MNQWERQIWHLTDSMSILFDWLNAPTNRWISVCDLISALLMFVFSLWCFCVSIWADADLCENIDRKYHHPWGIELYGCWKTGKQLQDTYLLCIWFCRLMVVVWKCFRRHLHCFPPLQWCLLINECLFFFVILSLLWCY
jgi:hypothetical protein